MTRLLRAVVPAWPRQLHRRGVLGMNWRNMNILARCNPKPLYYLTDDKLATKELCSRHGIAVPRTYAVVDHPVQTRRLGRLIGRREQFVVKPACGSAGRGVLIVTGRDAEGFIDTSGQRLSAPQLRHHLLATLGGTYSIGGRVDRAIIEQRVMTHSSLANLSGGGTPDIRIVIYLGRAVMAMLRLPTRASGGRANLHQGALGIGLDLKTGSAVAAVCDGRLVRQHPDDGLPIADILVPMWQDILDVALRLAGVIGLGYLGVDIVLSDRFGPVVLEANGRPGLSIQIANRCGLMTRIAEVDQDENNRPNPAG